MDNVVFKTFFPLFAAIIAPIGTKWIERLLKMKFKKQWHIIISVIAVGIATALTFVIVSGATHCAVTNLNWMPFIPSGSESTITVNPTPGSNCATEIAFNLKEQGDYVAIYKKIGPGSKLQQWWTRGIEFSYSGMGNPNTIEVKLLDGNSVPCKVVLTRAADSGGKTVSWSIPYSSLTCPAGTSFSRQDFALDRVDFTFSSWPGDTPGTGNVVIHDIQVVPAWPIWLIVFSPIGVVVIIVAYSLWPKDRREGEQQPEDTTRKGRGKPTKTPRKEQGAAASQPPKAKRHKG